LREPQKRWAARIGPQRPYLSCRKSFFAKIICGSKKSTGPDAGETLITTKAHYGVPAFGTTTSATGLTPFLSTGDWQKRWAHNRKIIAGGNSREAGQKSQ
jgi:hypothetical protein